MSRTFSIDQVEAFEKNKNPLQQEEETPSSSSITQKNPAARSFSIDEVNKFKIKPTEMPVAQGQTDEEHDNLLRRAGVLAGGINRGLIKTADLPVDLVATLIEQGSRLLPGGGIDLSGVKGGFEKLFNEFVPRPEEKDKLDRLISRGGEFTGGSVGALGAIAKTSKVVPEITRDLLQPVRSLGQVAATEAKISGVGLAGGTAASAVVNEDKEDLAFAIGAIGTPIAGALSPTRKVASIIQDQVVDRVTEAGKNRRAIRKIENDLPKTPEGEVDLERITQTLDDLAKLEADTGVEVVTTTRSVVDNPRIKARQDAINRKFAEQAEGVHKDAQAAVDEYLSKLDVVRKGTDVEDVDSSLREITATVEDRLVDMQEKVAREKDILIRGIKKDSMDNLELGIELSKHIKEIKGSFDETVNQMYRLSDPGKQFSFHVDPIERKVSDIIARKGKYSGLDQESPRFIESIVDSSLKAQRKGGETLASLGFVMPGGARKQDPLLNTFDDVLGQEGLLRKVRSEMRQEYSANRGSAKYRALKDLENTVIDTVKDQLPEAQWQAFDKAERFYRDDYSSRFIRGLGGRILKVSKTGEESLHREDILKLVWNRNNNTELKQFQQIYGDNPQALAAVEEYALRDLFNKMQDAKNMQSAFDVWKRDYADHLKIFKNVDEAVGSFEEALSNYNTLVRAADRNSRQLSEEFLKPFTLDRPQTAIKKSLDNPTYARNFRKAIDTMMDSQDSRETAYNSVRRLMWEEMQNNAKTPEAVIKYISDRRESLTEFLGEEALEEMTNFSKLAKILERNPNPHVSEPEFNEVFDTLEKLGADPLKVMSRIRHKAMGFVGTDYILAERLVHYWKRVTDKFYTDINRKIMFDGKMLSELSSMYDPQMGKVMPEKLRVYFAGTNAVLQSSDPEEREVPREGMEQSVVDPTSVDNDISSVETPEDQDEQLTPVVENGKPLLTAEGRPVYTNQFGDQVTERTITEQIGDKWYNIPTVYDGKFVDPMEAIDRVMATENEGRFSDPMTGREFQPFNSVEEAIKSAEERSDTLFTEPTGDTEMPAEETVVDTVFNELFGNEGASGDTTGAAETGELGVTEGARRAIPGSENMTDPEIARAYLEKLARRVPSGVPAHVQEAMLDTAYNMGTSLFRMPGLNDALDEDDWVKVGIEFLDTATIEGAGSKGLAARRARSYNKIAAAEQAPLISKVLQEDDGTISYLSEEDESIFSYTPKNGRHPSSKPGEIIIATNPINPGEA